MPIPNHVEFLGETGKTFPGSMQAICDAIQNYYRATGPRIDELYIIYKEIGDWLSKNVSSYISNSKDRKKESAVMRLKGLVIDELNAAEPGLGDALSGYAGRKNLGQKKATFQSLGKGYSHERASYLFGGKQAKPFSGSVVHTVAESQGLNFKKLTPKQWSTLATDKDMLKGANLDSTPVRMYFLNKIQRLRLQAIPQPTPLGVRWYDIGGNLLNTQFENFERKAQQETCQMYAMDRYGNLFVDYDNMGHAKFRLGVHNNTTKAARTDRGQTNHSSFCAGREVICAGCIFFWKGQLIHIDNNSGHYAPSPAALRKTVEILGDEGTSLDILRVTVARGDKLNPPYYHYKARTFLQNGQPDWPDQDFDADQDAVFAARPGFQP